MVTCIKTNTDSELYFKENEVVGNICQKYIDGLIGKQKEVFKDIIFWYLAEPEEKLLTLSGSAGTGKSHLLQQVLKALKEIAETHPEICRYSVALAAPTHKAIQVLNEYSEKAGIFPYIATIHSLLHVIPGQYDAKGKQVLKENKSSSQPHISEFRLVCVDECSMIDEELFAYISNSITPKILFMGDSCQLPPVRNEKDDENKEDNGKLAPIKTSPTFNLRVLNLTEPLRYGGAIADYATAIRLSMESSNPSFVRGKDFIKGDEPNITVLNQEDWESKFISMLEKDSLNVRAIAWTNNRVSSLADSARQIIYRDKIEYHVGEVLAAKELVSIEQTVNGRLRKKVLLYSCQECTVKSVSQTQVKIPGTNILITAFKLDLDSQKDSFTLYTPTKESLEKLVKPYLKQFKAKILETNPKARGGMWREYYECLEALCLSAKGNQIMYRLTYAGTMTCHQAQGSGYEHVFVDIGNLSGCQNLQMRARLIYTAITRSKSHLYVLDKYLNPAVLEEKTTNKIRKFFS
jgi:AAA domain/UvrD-like helicase C-terminal domain